MSTEINMTKINLSHIPGFDNLIQNDDNYNINVLKLNKFEHRTINNQKYKIIRYDKDILNIDLIPVYGLCRSIIVNSNNKVVSFSPPKSIPFDYFIKLYPNYQDEFIAEEFIEGTMINVFWDDSLGLNGSWEISTRNIVGATSVFYKKTPSKTFRDMFLEASNICGLDFDKLNKKFCYSFVLQHPENRIVIPFTTPRLYLVSVYEIINDENIIVIPQNIENIKPFFTDNTSIKFPKKYEYNSYSDLIQNYASMNTSYDIMGVVIYNTKTNERTKIRNPIYEEVRKLRGNQPKLQYQYLILRNKGLVSEFLTYYPENKKEFSIFRDQIHSFTNTLYQNYMSCYIKKVKPLIEFSEQFRTHMFHLHRIFLNELKGKNQHITNSIVINYVNNIDPTLLMYCLNYHIRRRNIDYIKSENELSLNL